MEGLPRPVVAIHTIGNSWRERKSLDDDTTMRFYQEMLPRFAGSIVSIDGESRAAILHDPRVRRLPSFGVESLAALLSTVDLLVGVDSGPLHLARLTRTKTLGLFMPTLPAQHVALPARELACLVPDAHFATNKEWKMVPYAGQAPGAEQIVDEAMRILAAEPETYSCCG
jgi:ADP-heptose:LPS heptosyltransferase